MNDWEFYGIAALIGMAGALVSQVLTLQQSLRVKGQIDNLEKKKKYLDLVITKSLTPQRDKFQERIFKLEDEVIKDTSGARAEGQCEKYCQEAKQERDGIIETIGKLDKQRNDLADEIFAARNGHFISPWSLVLLNVVVGALAAWLFGFIEVLSQGSGNAKLTINLVVEFVVAGAFWPLIWQRVFNTQEVEKRVDAAVKKFGVDTLNMTASEKPTAEAAPESNDASSGNG